MEGRVAHEHVCKSNELVKVVAERVSPGRSREQDSLSGLDEGLAMEGIGPHGLDDPADVAPEIELVPELGMTTGHFDIWHYINNGLTVMLADSPMKKRIRVGMRYCVDSECTSSLSNRGPFLQ